MLAKQLGAQNKISAKSRSPLSTTARLPSANCSIPANVCLFAIYLLIEIFEQEKYIRKETRLKVDWLETRAEISLKLNLNPKIMAGNYARVELKLSLSYAQTNPS